MVPTTEHPAPRLLNRVGQIVSLLCRVLPTGQFQIAETADFRMLINSGMDNAQFHFPTDSTYSWAMWTGKVFNVFDEMRHAEILITVTWAMSSAAEWSDNSIVDRFSVARFGKCARIGVDYTSGEMVVITASQLFNICKLDLLRSYDIVNASHRYYKK